MDSRGSLTASSSLAWAKVTWAESASAMSAAKEVSGAANPKARTVIKRAPGQVIDFNFARIMKLVSYNSGKGEKPTHENTTRRKGIARDGFINMFLGELFDSRNHHVH